MLYFFHWQKIDFNTGSILLFWNISVIFLIPRFLQKWWGLPWLKKSYVKKTPNEYTHKKCGKMKMFINNEKNWKERTKKKKKTLKTLRNKQNKKKRQKGKDVKQKEEIKHKSLWSWCRYIRSIQNINIKKNERKKGRKMEGRKIFGREMQSFELLN